VVSIYWQGDDPFPLKCWLQVTYPLLEAASFDILPFSASTGRGRKRSSITHNKNSTRAFQRAINQGSTPLPNFFKMGINIPKFVVFWTISTIKDEKSAAKFHYIKKLSAAK